MIEDRLEAQPWYQGEPDEDDPLQEARKRTVAAEVEYYEVMSYYVGNPKTYAESMRAAEAELDAARQALADLQRKLEDGEIPFE